MSGPRTLNPQPRPAQVRRARLRRAAASLHGPAGPRKTAAFHRGGDSTIMGCDKPRTAATPCTADQAEG